MFPGRGRVDKLDGTTCPVLDNKVRWGLRMVLRGTVLGECVPANTWVWVYLGKWIEVRVTKSQSQCKELAYLIRVFCHLVDMTQERVFVRYSGLFFVEPELIWGQSK